MSRASQKERKRANRRLKRREEHQQRMIAKLEKGAKPTKAAEWLSPRTIFGHIDMTVSCAIYNVENPDRTPRYGL